MGVPEADGSKSVVTQEPEVTPGHEILAPFLGLLPPSP